MTAANLCRRAGETGDLSESVDFIDSPIARSSANRHYGMVHHDAATQIGAPECSHTRQMISAATSPRYAEGSKILPGTPILKKPATTLNISLRPATQEDYNFAVELYLDSTKRLLTALGMWHEGRVVMRFKRAFRIDEVRVIRLDGTDIGWMQVSETIAGFHLHQIHIVERFRNRGIGTRLIQALLERARSMGRPVALNVIRGNPALSLYRRLGFRVVGGDAEKLHMRWDAEQLGHH